MKYICGIDEAGRGALLGPLVVAGVCMEERDLPLLSTLGVKDSKLLVHAKREALFALFIQYNISFFYSHLVPSQIDAHSLNALEIAASITIIGALAPHQVFLDVPARGRGIGIYCKRVQTGIHSSIEVVGGNKFDTLYPIVSAASIVAKVMRERAVSFLKEYYGDFGSGYPNQRTIAFVEKNYTIVEPIVRKKWKTFRELGI